LAPLASEAADAVEHITLLAQPRSGLPVIIKGEESISTKATFRPPVEITVEAKTDSTDLRLAYAANQIIFNWRDLPNQLRVDGGPASGQHKAGVGAIPANKYVTVRWVVLPTKQTLYVDDQLRFEHEGDYSAINNPVTVFCFKSKVSVKSIKVRPLSADGK
jgi:hypothetical protein